MNRPPSGVRPRIPDRPGTWAERRLDRPNERNPMVTPIGLTPRRATPEAHHVQTAVSSINTSRGNPGLALESNVAARRRFRCSAVQRLAAFFESDVVSIKKTPGRAVAGTNPPPARHCKSVLTAGYRGRSFDGCACSRCNAGLSRS
jgi:hypothetical protein